MTDTTQTTAGLATAEANALVARYIAIWNEHDAVRRRAQIAALWTEDASYVDPLMQSQGHSALDAMIQAVQEQYTGMTFRPRPGVDAHHRYVRFAWELVSPAGMAVAGGTDVATLAVDGRLQAVIGFLDFAPAPPA